MATLPDDVLEATFLRLDDMADLARAAATCTGLLPPHHHHPRLPPPLRIRTFIFCSVTGQWRWLASFGTARYKWMKAAVLMLDRSYARGCFFWTPYREEVMLVLDTTRHPTSFSVVDLPPQISKVCEKIVVDVGEQGKIGLLVLGGWMLDLYTKQATTTTRKGNGGDATGKEEEWRHEKAIPWPPQVSFPDYRCKFAGAADGYVLLMFSVSPWCRAVSRKKRDVQYFTLDLKTFRMERITARKTGRIV
ncbi:hypothetical protein PR202_ga11889 [Eleusine coracana subsp. coracana]|uniref:F-box domain-containing protein n=1 Tax=Eleusine coracana subsp. coracana TaxID=191504 RepID=A0AAV5CAT0_ELECO|nr:hypothetical protein PR202_ga11889 [Eleusine coracana subsp. coracana]